MGTWKLLWRSRKFQIALVAIGSTVLVLCLDIDEDTAARIAESIVTLAALLIGGIALEDAAKKVGTVDVSKDTPPDAPAA